MEGLPTSISILCSKHFTLFEYFSDERSEKQTFMCNQVMANIDMPPEVKTVPITQFH